MVGELGTEDDSTREEAESGWIGEMGVHEAKGIDGSAGERKGSGE